MLLIYHLRSYADGIFLSFLFISSLVVPEKSSSFSIHPNRLCSDVCKYCFGKFGSLDTPCHVGQMKNPERQRKILLCKFYLLFIFYFFYFYFFITRCSLVICLFFLLLLYFWFFFNRMFLTLKVMNFVIVKNVI